MARRSRWEHLKEEIIQHCKEGKTAIELSQMYPDVPRATIRDWHTQSAPDSAKIPPRFRQVSVNTETIAPQDTQAINPQQKLVALDGGEQMSDFALARRTLRAIAKNFNQPGAGVGVQAAIGLMKLTQLRAELPKHILDETEVAIVDEERDYLKEVSVEELRQQYKDLANG